MEKTNASKQGVLHWLDENFEKMFLVTGLLSITHVHTWQLFTVTSSRSSLSAPVPAVWTEELSATSLFGFPTSP